MHKNYKLLLTLTALIIVSLALAFVSSDKESIKFNSDLFSVADTSNIQSIRITGENEVSLAQDESGTWLVNGEFKADQSLRRVLMAVVNQVTIKRPVSKIQQEEIAHELASGNKISIDIAGETKEYYAGGSPGRTQSYFMEAGDDQPYIVEIPGYRNYVSGIFELTPLQWKDRKIFNTHWRSLQTLKVSYPQNPQSDINIYFEDAFFKIDGVTAMDTTALMNYLNRYQYFETNEFIPQGFEGRYDSLVQTNPLAIIEIEEINTENNQQLKIYPKLDNENFILGVNAANEMSLFDFRRIRPLLIRKSELSN
ncbi:MAG: hypothetical protein RJQ09_00215 [Cyclobacteriaceae bacterium]